MSGPYVLGIDFGTESVRVGVFDTAGTPIVFASQPYPLSHPHPGWAEQQPDEWWSALVAATRRALAESGVAGREIAGLGADCTSCTVVAMDEQFRVLRPAILWMDVRAAGQARRIAASGHPALKYNGYGSVSAEWLPCKVLWLKENAPETYRHARHIGEFVDWLTHRLTGQWTASINNASIRGYYDRAEGGWPDDFYEQIGLGDALSRFPPRVLGMGEVAGTLLPEVAGELGLPPGIPVAKGGADAFVAMIGLDVLRPGKLAFITGSSHVCLGQSATPLHARGIFGAYTDALLPGQYTVEGGQVSTGSVVKWFKDNFCGKEAVLAAARSVDVYTILDELARPLPPGSEGLVVLDYWQGNRTPYVDPEARGIIRGLSLKHTTGHLFRAILEGVAYGTEHILRTFRANGIAVDEMVAAGGPTRSPLWMQIHADVSNVPIVLTAVPDAAALGSAILGAVAAGLFPNVQSAAARMEPDPAVHEAYKFYVDQYISTYPPLQALIHETVRHVG
jgi:FGGY-family pentulose kinase